jgi:hypothetical protein
MSARLRRRIVQEQVPIIGTYKYVTFGTVWNEFNTTEPSIAFFEEITDDGTKPKRFNNVPYKPLHHVRVTGTSGSISGVYLSKGYQPYNWQLDLTQNLPGDPSAIAGAVPRPSEEQIRACGMQASNLFSAPFETKISAVNFALEFGETKSMIKDMLSLDFVRKVAKDYDKIFPSGSWRSLRIGELAQFSSSKLLELQFGWKPFITDLKALGEVLPYTLKRLDFLRRTYGKATPLHYSTNIPLTVTQPTRFIDSYKKDTTGHLEYNCPSASARFHAAGAMFHRIQGLDTDLGELKALASSIGLDKPGHFTWNAIPYSFVIDWLVEMDGFLNKSNFDLWGSDISYQIYGHSVKENALVQVWHRLFGAFDYQWRQTGTWTVSRYSRAPGIPGRVSDYTPISELSAQKQALLAALITQRIR